MRTKKQLVRNLKSRFPSLNKNRKAAAAVKVSRSLGMHLGQLAATMAPDELARYIRYNILPGIPCGGPGSWHHGFRALIRDLNALMRASETDRSLFIRKGNSKLPFICWSELPFFTCPGKGPCAEYCYTTTSWRNPGPYLRQLFNTIAMKYRKDLIRDHWLELPRGAIVRLYVDGDFRDLATLQFWLELCELRPDLLVYGYSKSWPLFLAHDRPFPANYMLNVSSGSKYGLELSKQLETLTRADGSLLVRGLFAAVAIDMTGINSKTRYSNPLYHKRVRAAILEQYGVRGWSCTGQCGSCASGKHACGSSLFQNVIIGIGIHGNGGRGE